MKLNFNGKLYELHFTHMEYVPPYTWQVPVGRKGRTKTRIATHQTTCTIQEHFRIGFIKYIGISRCSLDDQFYPFRGRQVALGDALKRAMGLTKVERKAFYKAWRKAELAPKAKGARK